MCVFKEREEVGRSRKEPAGLNSNPHHVALIRMAFPSPEHPNYPAWMLGKYLNSHGLVLGISGELWGSFCLSPCKCLSQEPWCLFCQEAYILSVGGTQGQSVSENPWVIRT